MSYKNAANKVSYLDRRANHSTKPFKRGNNEHLASRHYDVDYSIHELEPTVDQYLSDQDILPQLKAKLLPIEQTILTLAEQLNETLPKDKYIKLRKEKRKWGIEKQKLITQMAEIYRRRKGVTRFSENRFERLFVDFAREILPKDVFDLIVAKVNACQQ